MAAETRARKRWWATIGAGGLACVGCCALIPALAATGIAGSGVLLVGARWFEPVGFALIIIGIVGLVLPWIQTLRRRRAHAGCSSNTSSAESCGCNTEQSTAPPTGSVS